MASLVILNRTNMAWFCLFPRPQYVTALKEKRKAFTV